MFDIYIIQFSLLWEKLFPPHLRKTLHLVWGAVLVAPLQSLRDLIFNDYANGSYASKYDNATAYVVGDKVYLNRVLYKCIDATTGNAPTNTTYWEVLLDNRIGVRERIKYNSRKVLFEYALNRWFEIGLSYPQIYITNNNIYGTAFLLGATGEYSSSMANSSYYQQYYLGNTYDYNSYAFTIYVPIAVFNALASNNTDRENIIRGFANRYVISGMNYNVITY
jgi:hypothetical protein